MGDVEHEHVVGVRVDEHAAGQLRKALKEGLARRQLTIAQASVQSGVGRTTVSEALNSTDRVPSAQTVAALAKVLRLDTQALLDLRESAAQSDPGVPGSLGRLIGECDPLDLEVHPAGPARDAETALPRYVRRTHDEALAKAVSAAGAGRSAMAVLVGTSSTGKSRACWEAVQPLAACGWRLWHPYDPTRVDALLHGIGQVTSRTVVWLNEAQHYLDAGESVAAAIHGLLTDPLRAPVLVLATLWPDYATLYAAPLQPGQPDPHARTRELLAGRRIEVATEFGEKAVREAERLAAAGDRVWAEALAHDHDGRLAQHLAGAPELVRRYKELSPSARALLRVAMDARRLGAGPHLALGFLADAVEDYLDDDELHLLEAEDWLEKALTELAKPVHGDLAPLHRVHYRRPRRNPVAKSATTGGELPSGPRYRIADYLEQLGRLERRMVCPPLSFWAAAHAFLTNPNDLVSLAKAARDRHRLSWAQALYRSAADADDASALANLARIREEAGDRDEAERLALRAADAGDTTALANLARIREKRPTWLYGLEPNGEPSSEE